MNSKEFKPVEGGNGCGAEPTEWMTILEKSYGSFDSRSFCWMGVSPFDDFAKKTSNRQKEKQKNTNKLLNHFCRFLWLFNMSPNLRSRYKVSTFMFLLSS